MTDSTITKIGSANKLKGLEALQCKVGAGRLACSWMLRRGTVEAYRKQPAEQGRSSGHPDPLSLSLPPLQYQDLVRQRFGGVGKAPRKTGVHTLFG